MISGGTHAGADSKASTVAQIERLLPHNLKLNELNPLGVDPIGPRLRDGSLLILTGTDNDYSVTQNDSGVQFDVYVDFQGNSVQRDIDQPSRLNGVEVGPVPGGYVLIPGVLHAYKAIAGDLPSYVRPDKKRRFR